MEHIKFLPVGSGENTGFSKLLRNTSNHITSYMKPYNKTTFVTLRNLDSEFQTLDTNCTDVVTHT